MCNKYVLTWTEAQYHVCPQVDVDPRASPLSQHQSLTQHRQYCTPTYVIVLLRVCKTSNNANSNKWVIFFLIIAWYYVQKSNILIQHKQYCTPAHVITYLAVTCRSPRLFRHVFRFVFHASIYKAHMSPALNGSSAIWRFKHSNAIEILVRKGITFDFYSHTLHLRTCNMTNAMWGNIAQWL